MVSLSWVGVVAQETPVPAEEPRQSLSLLTYNVLADRVEAPLRMKALLAIMRSADADIVALQEVTPWILSALRDDEWVRETYRGSDVSRHDPAPGGQYFLSKVRILIRSDRWKPAEIRIVGDEPISRDAGMI
jgi:endonuclease/exonuclease/phosphatase family metal-dependent hydrolase